MFKWQPGTLPSSNLRLTLFLQIFTGPDNVEKKEWSRHDQALKVRLAQLHNDIAHAPVDNVAYIEALGDTLTSEIRQFFVENIEFFESDYSSSSSNKFIAHKNSTISQLEDQKKKLWAYLIFVIFFTQTKFLENKIHTEKRQFFALNL